MMYAVVAVVALVAGIFIGVFITEPYEVETYTGDEGDADESEAP